MTNPNLRPHVLSKVVWVRESSAYVYLNSSDATLRLRNVLNLSQPETVLAQSFRRSTQGWMAGPGA